LLCTVLFAAHAVDLSTYTMHQYVKDFDKHYNQHQYELHEKIFNSRIAEIISHNADPSQMYQMGVNKFTDLTEEELKSYRGYNLGLSSRIFSGQLGNDDPCVDSVPYSGALPASVDWRTAKPAVLTPVKDQGQCGGCWAFATTEAIESALALASGNLTNLSPQNVISCTPNPDHCGGTGGCGGATAELGFGYVAAHGIAGADVYPYKAQTGTCNETITKTAIIEGCVKLGENNYTDLVAAVATVGPLAVSVDASKWSTYMSGIFNGCDTEVDIDIDHVVQLVGYGSEKGTDYWIVRNSWGSSWGEEGYIRLLRHSDGSDKWCKNDVVPGDGSGCDGGPPTITVCGECGIWYDNSYPTGAKYL